VQPVPRAAPGPEETIGRGTRLCRKLSATSNAKQGELATDACPPGNGHGGYTGVRFDKRNHEAPWSARLTVNGSKAYIGPFSSKEQVRLHALTSGCLLYHSARRLTACADSSDRLPHD
jgi:hypothetical protein